MLIFRLLQKKYKDVNQTLINHILKHIKTIKYVGMDIRLFVVMIINIPNQLKFIGEKMLYTNSWRRC